MQQSLVLLVPHAELLQEQVGVPDDLLHLHIILQTDREGHETLSWKFPDWLTPSGHISEQHVTSQERVSPGRKTPAAGPA